MTEPRIALVDTPNWYAVLMVVRLLGEKQPRIKCIGFASQKERDGWLDWYSGSMVALWDAVPPRVPRR